jgi:hypothetical protein
MGRQRTINDAEFWRSPRIADRTQEDKVTLFYHLTSPYSNIIGVYAIVPRIAAAEMGWTAEQLFSVLQRLESVDLIQFDGSSGFIWVKNWWDHNSAKMAVASTLRMKTYAQIDNIPTAWRMDFLQDFLEHLPSGEPDACGSKISYRDVVTTDMTNRGYEVSIPYRQAKDRAAVNTTDNVNSNNYNVDLPLEFPVLDTDVQKQLAKIISRLPYEMRQDVLDEITAKLRSGSVRSPVRLAQHFADNPNAFVISEGLAVQNARQLNAA